MSKTSEAPPLSRKVRVVDIEDNAPLRLEPTPAEMADVATLLDLVALEGLAFDYHLRRDGARVHLNGRLKARVTQTCVVTLEPVGSLIDVPVTIEFWPATSVEELEHKVEDPEQSGLLDWPEAISDGTLDLGPVVYETLATALDPYPRREGASFEWSQDASEAEARETGPFAALKQLMDR
ncbi:MAG: DUF177 domain-containing protein [Hyphomicrobiales bacterium]